MSANPSHDLQAHEDIVALGTVTPRTGLHRLAAVRKERGMSYHELARRMDITVAEVRLQEEAADLSIGTLNRWATALDVPVTDLVIEADEWKHTSHLAKDEARRLMRVAEQLRDRARRRSVQRLAQTFVEQLTEILPILDLKANDNRRVRGPAKLPSLLPRANGHGVFDPLGEPAE